MIDVAPWVRVRRRITTLIARRSRRRRVRVRERRLGRPRLALFARNRHVRGPSVSYDIICTFSVCKRRAALGIRAVACGASVASAPRESSETRTRGPIDVHGTMPTAKIITRVRRARCIAKSARVSARALASLEGRVPGAAVGARRLRLNESLTELASVSCVALALARECVATTVVATLALIARVPIEGAPTGALHTSAHARTHSIARVAR